MKLLLYNHFNISSSSVLKGETNNLERIYKAFESLWQIWMNHFLLQGAFLTTAKCFNIFGFEKHCAKVDKMNHNVFNTLIYKLFSSKDIFFLDTKKKKNYKFVTRCGLDYILKKSFWEVWIKILALCIIKIYWQRKVFSQACHIDWRIK